MKKNIEKECRVYFHKCENKSEIKIKELYLIAKFNLIYNNFFFVNDNIRFEIPIKWKSCLFSDFQLNKSNKKSNSIKIIIYLSILKMFKGIILYRFIS